MRVILFGGGDKPKFRWEKLENVDGPSAAVWRTRVPGGWLLSSGEYKHGGLTFVPDSSHKWDGNSIAAEDTKNTQQGP